MKKTLIALTLPVALFWATALSAQANKKEEPTRKRISDKAFVEHNKVPDMIGSMDQLFINAGGKYVSIFESEGRTIEKVIESDLDNDGIDEYMIQMDCGGSGGYRDICLLQLKAGKYEPVFEETLADANIMLSEGKNSRRIIIKYIDDVEKKPIKIETMGVYFKNSKLITKKRQSLLNKSQI